MCGEWVPPFRSPLGVGLPNAQRPYRLRRVEAPHSGRRMVSTVALLPRGCHGTGRHRTGVQFTPAPDLSRGAHMALMRRVRTGQTGPQLSLWGVKTPWKDTGAWCSQMVKAAVESNAAAPGIRAGIPATCGSDSHRHAYLAILPLAWAGIPAGRLVAGQTSTTCASVAGRCLGCPRSIWTVS